METFTPTGLAEAAGISLPYASQVISGARNPSRRLAIHIYRRTGWKHAVIADLTDAQIDTLEQVEPWAPKVEAGEQDAAA